MLPSIKAGTGLNAPRSGATRTLPRSDPSTAKTAWREYIVFVKNMQTPKEAAPPSLFVICDVAFENRFLAVERYGWVEACQYFRATVPGTEEPQYGRR
jgi:hypothetical protein